MPESAHHCPFLNRADARCARHFSIDDLGYAFQYCFGQYDTCGAYGELLGERLVRRGQACGEGAGDDIAYNHRAAAAGGNVIQVTVAGRVALGAADPAVVSHASGV
jgi:hypothetical protein